MVSTNLSTNGFSPSPNQTLEGLDAWASRLRCVLDDRAALLAELQAASEQQDEIIESRDAARLMALMADRQVVVERFVSGQPELLDLTTSLEERLAQLPPVAADEIRHRVRSLSEGLSRITDRDELSQVELRRAREEARAELNRATTGAGARAAYGARVHGERGARASGHDLGRSVFADHKG
ncbi:MAG: hypothetical protein SGJ09_10930 [Phycisphaerae bacterium]|nr:hypothetical protein [Phycisphaerae bacterium]